MAEAPRASRGNLFAAIPEVLDAELVEPLTGHVSGSVRIERIVSRGHVSPPGFWYEQAEHEFVVLVAGAARIELDDGSEVALAPGDWIDLPAGLRHRVSWTDPASETVWLAVFRAALQ